MTDIIIAPRIEDPLSDVEGVINGGFFQVRASRWNVTSGQWISDAWPAPVPLTGIAVTAKLDASTVPYELYVKYPDGRGGFAERTEIRIVTSSGTPLKWENLELVGGADAPPPVASDFTAQLAALQAQVNALSAGSAPASLSTTTGISANGKTLIGGTNTYGDMRTLLDVPTTSTVNAKAPLADPVFTGNPQAPTPTAGDNDTSIATTAFVQGELTAGGFSLASPAFTGTPTAPTPTAGDNDTSIATTAFVDTSFAKKASPTFTGVPAAPTATVGTNTTQLATTAFVQAAVVAALAGTFTIITPVSGAWPNRPAGTAHYAYLSETLLPPAFTGTFAGGGGPVAEWDIFMRALP